MHQRSEADADAARDDARLVERARGGDAGAFETLYRRHAGRVHAVCRRITGDPTRAEDAVQEVFVRLWRSLGSFGGRSAFSTWLYRMAVNAAIDQVRAETRRRGREIAEDDVDGLDRIAAAGPRPESWDLEEAIDALPPGARIAFVLHDVEGYRHEEIAEMTGMASGTSRAHLHRARRLLRARLTR